MLFHRMTQSDYPLCVSLYVFWYRKKIDKVKKYVNNDNDEEEEGKGAAAADKKENKIREH